MKQLSLLDLIEKEPCEHKACFETSAYVPAGLACFDCGKLLAQFIPYGPDLVGYITADWAWHHVHCRPWTTQYQRQYKKYGG